MTTPEKLTSLVPFDWDTGPLWERKRSSISVKEVFQKLGEISRTDLVIGKSPLPFHTVRVLPATEGSFSVWSRQGELLYRARKLKGQGNVETHDALDILGNGKLHSASDIGFCHERPGSLKQCDLIDFPYHMRQNMIQFLRSPPPTSTWDCRDFVSAVHGKFWHASCGTFNHAEWDHIPLEEGAKLKNGDTIFMRNMAGDVHFAVLLSEEKGQWISKHGSASLSISTLKELKDEYAPDQIYLIVPKPSE